MQRKSWFTTAAAAGGLTLGLVFGSAAYDNIANAQTASPSASASASASASTAASAPAALGDTLKALFLDNLAEALGIDRAALDSAITSAGTATAAEAVANGTLTQEQADRFQARIEAGNFGFGFGGGRGGHGGFGDMGGARVLDKQVLTEAAAAALNLSTDELIMQLRSGETLAAIAEAQGTTEQTVIDATLAAAKTQLDQAVADGTVTQEQADAAYARLEERGADLLVGGGRHGGPGGDMPQSMPTTPEASPSTTTTPDA